MVPGVPTDDEITAETKPTTRSTRMTVSAPRSASAMSMQDKWEDIREAVVETETFATFHKGTSAVTSAVSYTWQVSKRIAWIAGTSAVILVIPLLYEIDKELGFDPAVAAQAAASSAAPAPASASGTDSVAASAAPDASSASSSAAAADVPAINPPVPAST